MSHNFFVPLPSFFPFPFPFPFFCSYLPTPRHDSPFTEFSSFLYFPHSPFSFFEAFTEKKEAVWMARPKLWVPSPFGDKMQSHFAEYHFADSDVAVSSKREILESNGNR